MPIDYIFSMPVFLSFSLVEDTIYVVLQVREGLFFLEAFPLFSAHPISRCSLVQILLNYDNLYLKYIFYSAFLKKRTFHGILSIINYQFSSVLLLQSPGKDRCTGHDKKILIYSTEYAVFEKTCEQTLMRCGDAMFFSYSRALNYST